ncbi:MAG: 2-amino-4-hydroxy-6-hydroxymethyldihydropteridine diphosphokinase [Verrucomicrobia bacterium]|nr:2-amino-4-hydroxy-6-hydroxymethyldihydropteridine diphosphokinase [Verrucomicrobiota bacterium]MBU1734116.1 2-amino-4-hydroxy-6-hydroxymethyldihydropteridine diphosphokinase [Verrucomicrobiota bacterium]MBU1856430.1 2-amino-4-hydroxy-6-hydroxymethyldihydropteridine diphosphokinase [Verrucomicrobiota bacterium]
MEVGLSLGSNMGDRLAHLQNAKAIILDSPGIVSADQSPAYETEPVDVPPEFQALNFLNAILIVKTLIPLSQLMQTFQFMEQKIGRVPNTVINAPRPMDIDIIYADALQIQEQHIVIPHPHWTLRRFVVQPLYDVRPDLVIPGQTGTVADVLAGLSDTHKVVLFAKKW